MSGRVWWIVVGLALAVMLGLAALYLFNASLSDVTLVERDGRRTWIIHGEERSVSISARDVRRDESYVCEAYGTRVDEVPATGPRIWAEKAEDGTVTVACGPMKF